MVHLSPIDRLNQLMSRNESCLYPTIQKIMEVARETIGLSEANYLEWQERFLSPAEHVDGITVNDLDGRSLVWGYDPEGRFFVTFQLKICTHRTTETETCTLFQRYANRLDTVIQRGEKKYRMTLDNPDCMPQTIETLRALFSGERLHEAGNEWKNERFIPAVKTISLMNWEPRSIQTTDVLRIEDGTATETVAQSPINQGSQASAVLPTDSRLVHENSTGSLSG